MSKQVELENGEIFEYDIRMQLVDALNNEWVSSIVWDKCRIATSYFTRGDTHYTVGVLPCEGCPDMAHSVAVDTPVYVKLRSLDDKLNKIRESYQKALNLSLNTV